MIEDRHAVYLLQRYPKGKTMPTPLLADDIVEVRIWTASQFQAAVNRIHYHVQAVGAPAATDQDLIDELQSATTFVADYKAILSAQAIYEGIEARILNRIPKPAHVTNDSGAGPGSEAGDALPPQTAGIISWRTNFSGPAYRGRIYLPFPAEVDSGLDGQPTVGYAATADIVAADLHGLSGISQGGRTATVQLVLLHQGVLFPYTPITSFVAKRKWATQKKRGIYGQANSSPF